MDIEWNVHVTVEDEHTFGIYGVQRKINTNIDMPKKLYIFFMWK